jgi:menaquinol-cytochrome c reductase cytochrome b/c subunit
VFRSQCAGCHGTKGEGNLGPPLVGIADRMPEADELAQIRNGRGRMPPFSPALSDDDIAAVVAYVRTELH